MIEFAKEISEKFNLMRAVSVRFFHAQEATSGHQQKTGQAYSDIISENFVMMPEKIDMMDPSSFETLRHVWLTSLDRQTPVQDIVQEDETVLGAFVRLLKQENSKVSMKLMKAFVASAKYPVPYEFTVVLPKQDKSLRRELLGMIPFVETREMLNRLEDSLDLPMRHIDIVSTPISGVAGLQASLH